MVTVRDVPPDRFIDVLAQYIKNNIHQVKPPLWSVFVKTGPHRERVPDNPDWWYYRAASILRKLYLSEKPIGIETFRVIYGGLKRRGSAPPHFKRCSGSHIRLILQQLEKSGLVTKTRRGRIITSTGRALLDELAYKVFMDIIKAMPELKKYGPSSLRQ